MTPRRKKKYRPFFWGLLLFMVLCSTAGLAETEVILSNGQTVYVPIYSHIYVGPKSHPQQLTATLSIRNTDTVSPITIVSADYYDSDGKLVSKYVKKEVRLNALATARYIIKTYDESGGSGAKFIVRWRSKEKVNAPIIEGIMIGQKVSFISRGQVIRDVPK